MMTAKTPTKIAKRPNIFRAKARRTVKPKWDNAHFHRDHHGRSMRNLEEEMDQ
jgi:hypothetical protein